MSKSGIAADTVDSGLGQAPQPSTSTAYVYPGEIRTFATPACPAGWLLADGSPLARSDWPELAPVIGNLWGSPSIDKINLPDARGVFLRGWQEKRNIGGDPDAGSRIRPPGAPVDPSLGLNQVGTFQPDDFLKHHHPVQNVSVGPNAQFNDNRENVHATDRYGMIGIAQSDDVTGGGLGNETRPRNIAVLYCIYPGVKAKP